MNLFGKPLDYGVRKRKVGYLEVSLSITQKDGYEIEIEIENTTEDSKFIGDLKIGDFEPSEKILMNNYQSWGPCTFVKPSEIIKSMHELSDNFVASPVPWEFKDGLISDYFIADDKTFAGFLSSKVTHPYFKWHDGMVDVKIYVGKHLKPHEKIKVETLWVKDFSKLEETLELYAKKVANSNTIKKFRPLFGWESWYSYYLNISQDSIIGELDRTSEIGMKYEVFQIDDGYEKDIGDWLETNEKFPEGLEFLSKKIKKSNMMAGIWTAPFSISETSSIFKYHKDFLVKDENGIPIVAYENWNKKIYALDTSNPDALFWLGEIFSTLKGYGYEFFKIDFLFAGMIPGKRFLDVTPVEAYRMGMKKIADTVGNTHVLGCGAPLLPSIGYVDSMRIGCDTAPEWRGELDMGVSSAKFSIRNALTRNFMNAWWVNDPDCVMVRSSDTNLTNSERMINIYIPALLNGQFLESDFLGKLSDDDLHLLGGAFNFRNGISKVILLDKERYAVVTKKSINGDIISFVNLSDFEWKVEIENYRPFFDEKVDEFFVLYPSMKHAKNEIKIVPHAVAIIMHRGKRNLRRDDEKEDDGRDIHYYWGEEYDGTSTQSYNR